MKDKKENVESAIKRLEKIVADLQGKDTDIEEGLVKFREGVELIRYCRGELGKAENEFKKLKAELDEDGEAASSEDAMKE